MHRTCSSALFIAYSMFVLVCIADAQSTSPSSPTYLSAGSTYTSQSSVTAGADYYFSISTSACFSGQGLRISIASQTTNDVDLYIKTDSPFVSGHTGNTQNAKTNGGPDSDIVSSVLPGTVYVAVYMFSASPLQEPFRLVSECTTYTSPCAPASCMTCSSASQCTSCSFGSTLASGSCSACNVQSCSSCPTSSNTCTTCNSGYYLSSGSCIAGSSPVSPICASGCSSCTSSSAFSCTSCNNGYYLSSGSCNTCAQGCSACSSFGSCSACSTGYYLSSGTCIAGSSPCASGCSSCTSSSAFSCTACNSGYYLSSGSCFSCAQGCSACSSLGSCSACRTGYYMSSGTCIPNSSPISPICAPGCTSCSSATSCTICNSGYSLSMGMCVPMGPASSSTGTCSVGVNGCSSCSILGKCQTCSSGYYFQELGSSCVSVLAAWTTPAVLIVFTLLFLFKFSSWMSAVIEEEHSTNFIGFSETDQEVGARDWHKWVRFVLVDHFIISTIWPAQLEIDQGYSRCRRILLMCFDMMFQIMVIILNLSLNVVSLPGYTGQIVVSIISAIFSAFYKRPSIWALKASGRSACGCRCFAAWIVLTIFFIGPMIQLVRSLIVLAVLFSRDTIMLIITTFLQSTLQSFWMDIASITFMKWFCCTAGATRRVNMKFRKYDIGAGAVELEHTVPPLQLTPVQIAHNPSSTLPPVIAPATLPPVIAPVSMPTQLAPVTVPTPVTPTDLRTVGSNAEPESFRKFCGECGASSSGTKFCENCGNKI